MRMNTIRHGSLLASARGLRALLMKTQGGSNGPPHPSPCPLPFEGRGRSDGCRSHTHTHTLTPTLRTEIMIKSKSKSKIRSKIRLLFVGLVFAMMAMGRALGAQVTVQPAGNVGFDVYADGVLVAPI